MSPLVDDRRRPCTGSASVCVTLAIVWNVYRQFTQLDYNSEILLHLGGRHRVTGEIVKLIRGRQRPALQTVQTVRKRDLGRD